MKRTALAALAVYVACTWHFNRAAGWPHESWAHVAPAGERVVGEIVGWQCWPSLDLVFIRTQIGGGCHLAILRWARHEPIVEGAIPTRWVKEIVYAPVNGLAYDYYVGGTYRSHEGDPDVTGPCGVWLPPPTIYDSEQCHPDSYVEWFYG